MLFKLPKNTNYNLTHWAFTNGTDVMLCKRCRLCRTQQQHDYNRLIRILAHLGVHESLIPDVIQIQVTRPPVLMWAAGIIQEQGNSSHTNLENMQEDKTQTVRGELQFVSSFVRIWTIREIETASATGEKSDS